MTGMISDHLLFQNSKLKAKGNIWNLLIYRAVVSEETIAMHCLMVCLNYIPIFVLRMRQIAFYSLRGSLATVALPVPMGLARGLA